MDFKNNSNKTVGEDITNGIDYAKLFENIVEDSGRHNVRPAKISSTSQEILIMMIDCTSETQYLAKAIGKTTREMSARLFRLKKSGYVKKGKEGWEMTLIGDALAKYFRNMKKKNAPMLVLKE